DHLGQRRASIRQVGVNSGSNFRRRLGEAHRGIGPPLHQRMDRIVNARLAGQYPIAGGENGRLWNVAPAPLHDWPAPVSATGSTNGFMPNASCPPTRIGRSEGSRVRTMVGI